MWRLGGCPHCDGDLFIAKDEDGWYGQCLQCGRRFGLKPLVIQKPVIVQVEDLVSINGSNEAIDNEDAS